MLETCFKHNKDVCKKNYGRYIIRQQMASITYATIHHDPEGRCNEQLRRHVSTLGDLFVDSFIVVTRETVDPTTKVGRETSELLEQAGFRVTVRSQVKSRQLDTATDIALIAAKERGKGNLIMTGLLDRTLHWLDTYPDELNDLLENGTGDLDMMIIGRTERAFFTHPKEQRDPEIYTNLVTARLLGMEHVDVAAGVPSLMTRETARTIIDFLKDHHRVFNPEVDINDAAWPIIAKFRGKKLGYVEVEGLEFETPDQFKNEIEELGYDEWVKRNFTEANVQRRWERAYATEIKIKEFIATADVGGKERL